MAKIQSGSWAEELLAAVWVECDGFGKLLFSLSSRRRFSLVLFATLS